MGCEDGYGLHGLGDDFANGGDGGGGFTDFGGGGGGGGIVDTGGVAIDPTTIPGFTPPGSDIVPVAPDTVTPSPLPYVDASAGLPPGSTIDMSTGTIFGPGGSFTIFNDGSFMDAAGNLYDSNGNLLAAAQPNAPASVTPPGSSGGGGSAGGSGRSGGGSGSGSSGNLAQMLACVLNPNSAGCRSQQTGAGGVTRPATSSTSFSSVFNKYWGWGLAFIAVVWLLPNVLPSSGRR